MKKLIILSIILQIISLSYSQDVRIVLKTRYNFRDVEFDSIVVVNTRTLDTLRKFYPDTILYSSTVGIHDYQSNPGFGFEAHYQNPYMQETEISLNVTKPEMITLSLNDISGRLCNSYSQFFNPGIYKFRISALNEGFYLINARSKSYSHTIKLIQTTAGSDYSILLTSESPTGNGLKPQSPKSDDSDFFHIGDRLLVQSYYKHITESTFLYTTVSGYCVHYLSQTIPCDSIDLTGKWYILAPMSLTGVYPIPDPSLRYQNEVIFISDSVFSTTTLQTPSVYSIWPSGTIGVTKHYKYKVFPDSSAYPFVIYPMSAIVANITTYETYNALYFHFRDCNTVYIGIDGFDAGGDTFIRDPESY